MDEEREYYLLVKRAFGGFAPFYDIVVKPISKVRERVVDLADTHSDLKVLDVATGTGKQAFAFAKRGYDVIGIDLSEAMLKIAIKKNRYEKSKFGMADATNLPFKENSFDISCISFGLHEMPLSIRQRTLKEMIRVTKSKGMIIIVDYALPENKVGRFLVYRFVKLYEGEYYSNFIKSDFKALLKKHKIKTEKEQPIVCGGAKILRGIVDKD